MLTKGIVEKIITPYKIKVRLPIFDAIEGTRNATETNELSEAIICSLPNSSNLVNIGDIVIIGFEDNDISKPIILGHLLKESASKSLADLKLGALTTFGNTNLSRDTYIGNIKPSEIEALSGIESNIQGQINNLYDKLGSSSGGGVSTNDIIIGTYDETKGTGVLNIRETEDSYPLFKISASTGEQSYVHRTLYTQTLRPETGSVAYDIGSSGKWYENGYLRHIKTATINDFPFKVVDFQEHGRHWDEESQKYTYISDIRLISPKFTGTVNRLTFGMLRDYYHYGGIPIFNDIKETITLPAGTRCDIALLQLPQWHTYTFKCETDSTDSWVGYRTDVSTWNGGTTSKTFSTANSNLVILRIENNSSSSAIFKNFMLIEIGEEADTMYASTESFDGYTRDVVYQGNLHGDLLWTNTGITMSSTVWSISNNPVLVASLFSYTYIVIAFYGWEGDELHYMKFPVKDGEYTLYNVTGPTLSGINTRRFVIAGSKDTTTGSGGNGVTGITITWQDAQVGNSAATSVKQNACVPYRIYGLR